MWLAKVFYTLGSLVLLKLDNIKDLLDWWCYKSYKESILEKNFLLKKKIESKGDFLSRLGGRKREWQNKVEVATYRATQAQWNTGAQMHDSCCCLLTEKLRKAPFNMAQKNVLTFSHKREPILCYLCEFS